MINQEIRKKIIRYMQILFVVLAFGLMVIASYLFVSNIERKNLMDDTMAVLNFSELKIEADLMEPETLMGSISQTIRSMILRGNDTDEISRYMTDISNNVIRNKNRKLSSTGVYGLFEVFDNKFIDLEWTPPADYVPQDRPWYKTAVAAEGKVAVTPPYLDMRTKSVTIAYVVRIFDENNTPLAVLSMNVPIYRISEYIIETRLAEGGYGFLLSENMELIAHPDTSLLGVRLRNVRSYIAAYEDELREKGFIYGITTIDYRGIKSIVFLQKLYNGWYIGIVTPKDKYYQTTRNMALYLTTLGAILAMALIAVLLVLFRQMNRENEKSRAMAHWYNSILNAIPLPISVTDADTKWTFVNAAVEKYLGITLEDAVGKPCNNWGSSICNTPDCGIACVKRGLTQTYFSKGDSSYQIDVTTLKDLNGTAMGYIEVVQDITNLKLMAKKQADAEAANLAKSTFLAKVSHEVRTPMNAILGITEIQLQDETLPRGTQEALGSIYNSGYLLLSIINDILDLSKIEAGKLELTPVNYDVPSLINDTVHLNFMRYDSKPIEFILKVEENIPTTLFGDELRIKQILNNLLSNAFKYTNSGKVTLSVACEAQQQGEADGIILVFRVADTGQGMTAEQLNKLFEDYTRFNTEANRTTIGTGLGMAITKYLVRMMNGTISVESEPGKGSVFTVRIPQGTVEGSGVLDKELVENLKQFRLGKAEQMKKAPQIIREYMPYGKVLVVDDVGTNLYVAKGLLAPYGLAVETARSGFEAIDKIKDGEVYDIIFMDHFMPEMDGIETTKRIRELGYARPIVALTANALAGQAEVFAANGFDDFISKPIDIRQLNAALNKLVRDKHPVETVEAARRHKESLKNGSANGNSASQPPINPDLVRFFTEDAEKAAAALEKLQKKEGNYGEEDIKAYILNVHAMKSALANIGETALSAAALKLEQAGRMGNTAIMISETPAFMDSLRTVIEKVKPKDDDKGSETMDADDRPYLLEKLAVLQEACAEFNKKAAKAVVTELRKRTWPRPVNELLDAITERLLHSEFSEAAGLAKDYSEKLDAHGDTTLRNLK